MLVLSRKMHESIQIGPEVVVRVVGITRNQVRLGIEAPDACRILRAELPRESTTRAPRMKPDAARHRPIFTRR